MKVINTVFTSCLLISIVSFFSCRKSTTPKETVDPTKNYTGSVIARDCPSIAIIEVDNANIGVDWTYITPRKNVIGITNCPDSLSGSGRISFRLLKDDKTLTCVQLRPCPAVVLLPEYPKAMYCATDIAIAK